MTTNNNNAFSRFSAFIKGATNAVHSVSDIFGKAAKFAGTAAGQMAEKLLVAGVASALGVEAKDVSTALHTFGSMAGVALEVIEQVMKGVGSLIGDDNSDMLALTSTHDIMKVLGSDDHNKEVDSHNLKLIN